VEAAAAGGRPVFFDTVTPSDSYWSEETAASRETPQAISWVQTSYLVLLVVIALCAVLLAMHNWRGGRGDRRGSVRLAICVLTLSLLYWAVTGHHVSDLGEESVLMLVALGNALTLGLLSWVLYMALEPYARRLWPEALVSWSRILAGRFSDPLVGRDLLIGFVFGTGFVILNVFARLLPKWMGLPPSAPFIWGMQALNGGRWAFGQVFIIPLISLSVPLGHFMLFLLLRIILRKQWLAAIAYCAILSLSMAVTLGVQAGEVSQGLFFYGAAVGALIAVIVLTVLVRFGLLAAAGCFLMANLIPRFPITLDASTPYFTASLFGLLVAAAITVAAFYVSLAGRSMFGEALLRD
jgi:hypothetical protein